MGRPKKEVSNNPAEREKADQKRDPLKELDTFKIQLTNLERSISGLAESLAAFRSDFLTDSEWKTRTENVSTELLQRFEALSKNTINALADMDKKAEDLQKQIKEVKQPVASVETLKSSKYQIIGIENGMVLGVDRPMPQKEAAEKAKKYHIPCVILPVV